MQVLNELKFIFKLVDGLRSSLEQGGMSGECARNLKGQSGGGQPPDLWKRECGKARSPIKGRLRGSGPWMTDMQVRKCWQIARGCMRAIYPLMGEIINSPDPGFRNPS
jgi:hypothetical protein